jgi:hypothetical protein
VLTHSLRQIKLEIAVSIDIVYTFCHIRSSHAAKIISVAMNRPAQRSLLWSKMSFPLIGDTGKVPKKDPMMHISKPAPPIATYPPFKSKKKSPPNAKLMRIPEAETIAPSLSVNFDDWFTLRVGEEKGTLNAKVVNRNKTSPKGQILCSLHTPRLRMNAMAKNFWTKPTRTLVAKKTGRSAHI